MDNYSLREKEIIDKLFQFFSSVEIKDQRRADLCETKSSSLSASLYMSAKLLNDSFLTYNYDIDSVMTALNCSTEMAQMIIDSKFKILNDIDKQRLQIYMRKKVVEEYEEVNDYYRELSGLPKKGEEPLKLKDGKLVTELTDSEIMFIYNDELDAMRKKYFDKKYLNHLGEKAIDPLFSRASKNFSILYYQKGIFNDEQNKKLIDYYYECLGYVESVLYSKAFVHYEYYNTYMIMLLSMMTMQRYLVSQLENGIRREYIDEESVKALFDSYDLPYWNHLPLKYKKRLVKNMNKLFMYKGTDKVIIDIVKLLGFENVEIFKHYLVKDAYRDEEGNIQDDLSFVGIPINETNIQNAIRKSIMIEGYDNMTLADPFWGTNDTEDEIKRALMEEEFNYISTKYLSINTIYNVTQMTNEVCYFFQLINKLEREYKLDLYFYSMEIKPNGGAIRLYDAIVSIYYLVCKKNHFVDRIITSNTQMASVFGFNFDTDIEELKRILEAEDLTISKEFMKVFDIPPGFLRKKDIIDLFFNNREFKDKIERTMLECDDINTYKALKRIHSYNMYCENNKDQFKREDGTYYETYLEYLKDKDSYFAEFLEENSKDKNQLLITLNNIFYALESFLDSEKFKFVFIGLSTISSEVIKDYLKSLIDFFKSYTAELRQLNAFFVIDDRFTNTIKLLSEVKINSSLDVASMDKNIIDFFEDIYFKVKEEYDDKITIDEMVQLAVKLTYEEKLILREFIASITTNREFYDKNTIIDEESIRVMLNRLDSFNFEEMAKRYIYLNQKEETNLKEKIFVNKFEEIIDKGILDMDDVLTISNKINSNEKFSLLDYIIYSITHEIDADLNIRDKVYLDVCEKNGYKLIKSDDYDHYSLLELYDREKNGLNLHEVISIHSNE